MAEDKQNNSFDIGYFQAIRDLSMIFSELTGYYNAKDLQKIVNQIKESVFKIKAEMLIPHNHHNQY